MKLLHCWNAVTKRLAKVLHVPEKSPSESSLNPAVRFCVSIARPVFVFGVCLLAISAINVRGETLPPEAGNGLVRVNGVRMNLAVDPSCDITCNTIFARVVEKTFGVKIPIYRKNDPKLNNYVVRFLNKTESAKMDSSDSAYFILSENGKTLHIGKNIRYGLYDFMKRFLGYRQFGGMPEEEIFSPLSFIDLPKTICIHEKPSIPSYLAVGCPNPFFSRADRMTSRGTHAFWEVIPQKKYGESHPEYYPLIDGKRRVPKEGIIAGWQPCLANPDLPKLVMEYADRYFKTYPDRISLPLGVNDAAGDCLCAFCSSEYKKHGNQYAAFYARTAKELEKRHPGKLLSFIAYGRRSCAVPKNLVMPSNVLVEVIGLNRKELSAWKAVGIRHFGVYEYLYTAGSGFLVPHYFPHKQVELWRSLNKEFGLTALFNEYSPCETVVEGARQYVLDETAWNINADTDALLHDYFHSMYAESAVPVARFFCRLEEIAERDPNLFQTFRYWRSIEQMKFYTHKDLAFLTKQLLLAEKSASTPEVRKRLLRLKNFYACFQHYVELYLVCREMKEQKIKSKTDLNDAVALLTRAADACAKIPEFTLSPEEEASVFYPKRMTLEKYRSQYNLLAMPILDSAADILLARADEFLKKQNASDETKRVRFWSELSEKTENSILKTLFLCPLYSDPQKHEYIRNGGFEPSASNVSKSADVEGWNLWRSSKEETDAAPVTTEKFEGTASYSFGKNTNDMLLFSWNIAAKPFCRYRVTCMVKQSAIPEGFGCGSVSIRKDWSNGSWLTSASVPPESVGNWVELEMTFTMPADAKCVVFAVSPPKRQDGSRLYIDRVSMRKIFDPQENFKR